MSKFNVSKTMVLVCGLGIFGAVDQAAAQRPTRFDISGFGGWYIASDLYSGTNGTNTRKIEAADAATYGGRIGFSPTGHIGLEFSYARAVSDLTSANPIVPSGGEQASATLDQFDFNFLFGQPSGNRGLGYFTLGLGWSTVSPTVPGSTTFQGDTFFAWNFGLGLKAYMGRSALFRIDARYRGIDTNRTTGVYNYCDFYGYCYTYASSIYYSGEITAGLGFRF